MKIILGSQSKGRRLVLEEAGMDFEIMPANIDEKTIRHEDPEKMVLAIARAKADALIPKITEPAILITADQVVLCNGEVREKPENIEQGIFYLKSYAKYPAETIGSVIVINTQTLNRREAVNRAKIWFSPFSNEEIEKIINDPKVLSVAGGFTTEGEIFSKHIIKIEGGRDSILGLPLELTKKLIAEVL